MFLGRSRSVNAVRTILHEETIFAMASCTSVSSHGLCIRFTLRTLHLRLRLPLQRANRPIQISHTQIAVSLVSIGVVLATLSRPTSSKSKSSNSDPTTDAEENVPQYFIGIAMLTASLVCTGILGLLQERTYKKYGPCWREGVFYTVRVLPLSLLSHASQSS